MSNIQGKVHDLIRAERRKRGLPHAYWSRGMARLAQVQANYCAKVGHMVHSDRYAFQGGENLAGGNGNFTPKAIVDCWMHSKAGHREYLLDPRVAKCGVGIAKARGKTFAAWAFSDEPPSFPDCLCYKSSIRRRLKGGRNMLRLPVKVVVICASVALIVLGIHGLYVYFNTTELFFGGGIDKLFLTFEVPARLTSVVVWMSVKGILSWFLPAVFVVAGLIVWGWGMSIDTRYDILRRLHLW